MLPTHLESFSLVQVHFSTDTGVDPRPMSIQVHDVKTHEAVGGFTRVASAECSGGKSQTGSSSGHQSAGVATQSGCGFEARGTGGYRSTSNDASSTLAGARSEEDEMSGQ